VTSGAVRSRRRDEMEVGRWTDTSKGESPYVQPFSFI
jgi:hypothetical protein